MIQIAIISKNLKVANFIENRATSFKWITCDIFCSLDTFFKSNVSDYKIVLIGRGVLEGYHMPEDGVDIVEWVSLVNPKAKVIFIPKRTFICRKILNSLTQKIFLQSLAMDAKTN